MAKTSVEIDQAIAQEAAAILGTTTLRETVDAALREIVNLRKRLEFIELMKQTDRFDFDAIDNAWGGDE